MNKFYETVEGTTLRIGEGCTNSISSEIKLRGKRNVLVITDPNLAKLVPFSNLLLNLRENDVRFAVFSCVKIEPTLASIEGAIKFAKGGEYDLIVAFGGGSVIDTAKLTALHATNREATIRHFIAKPFGNQEPPVNLPLELFVIATTSGTGSESSCVSVFHEEDARTKGFARGRFLRPQLAFIDPLNVMTMPRDVAIFSGLDMLIHTLESMTAKSYADVQAFDCNPQRPLDKPIFQGRNPLADIWLKESLRLMCNHFYDSVENPTDMNARAQMQLATTYIGYGTGNVGVHLPHGLSYPISGRVKTYTSSDYPGDPLVPHGLAVVTTACACFKFTAPANPKVHLESANVMGLDTEGDPDGGATLSTYIQGVMRDLKVPNGLKSLGVHEEDLDDLLEGAGGFLKNLKICPRQPTSAQILEIYRDSMSIY